MSSAENITMLTPSFEISQLNKYIKYINFVIIYIVTFTLVLIPKYEIVGMVLLLSFNFIIQPLLLYDIFLFNDMNNTIFVSIIVTGTVLCLLSVVYILKMLVRVRNKNHEVGQINLLIDKNTNKKYHTFTNLYMINAGLILINSIIYFFYKVNNNTKYSNNYLYNTLNYDFIDNSFFKNILYRTNEFYENRPLLYPSYPFIFLGILIYNLLLTIFINTIKTLYGLYNDFLNTFLFLFKSASLIAIFVLSVIMFVFSTIIAVIRFKRKNIANDNKTSYKGTTATNTGMFSQLENIFNNLNMNYLMNYKIVT